MAQQSQDIFRTETVREIEMTESPWEFLYVEEEEEEKEDSPNSSSSAAKEDSLLTLKTTPEIKLEPKYNGNDQENGRGDESLSSSTQSPRTSSWKRTFQCHWCQASFPRLKHLKRHFCAEQKNETVLPKEKLFKCSKCDKTFHKRHVLNLHLENHKDDEKSQGSPETVTSELTEDQKENKNTPQLRLQCPECNLRFLNLAHLHHHRYRHHDQQHQKNDRKVALPPLKCDKCPTRFFKECWLDLHRSSVHKEGVEELQPTIYSIPSPSSSCP